jgi:hypothetical protein
MSDESDRMLTLLQELAILKDEARKTRAKPAPYRKRMKEIKVEMKELAAQKERNGNNS